MEYRVGSMGRVIVSRFDQGEDFLEGLKTLVKNETVKNGWFQILGGLRRSSLVTGPIEPVMPPEPVWEDVDGARETVGSGTIFWNEGEPVIHLHAGLGHHGKTTIGCIRKNTTVYLLLEVIIFEIEGFAATRPFYEAGGFNRLTFNEDKG